MSEYKIVGYLWRWKFDDPTMDWKFTTTDPAKLGQTAIVFKPVYERSDTDEQLLQVAVNICNEFGFGNIGDELEELIERLRTHGS